MGLGLQYKTHTATANSTFTHQKLTTIGYSCNSAARGQGKWANRSGQQQLLHHLNQVTSRG
jgi:hypothetical protein